MLQTDFEQAFLTVGWMRSTLCLLACLVSAAPRAAAQSNQPPVFAAPGATRAHEPAASAPAEELPDAPQAQTGDEAGQSGNGQQPASGAAPAQSGSGSQQPAQADPKSRRDKSAEQIKAEEKQRVLGIMPSFNTSYINDAATLSARQKMSLAFRTSIDPFTFATAFIVAGLNEALHDDTGFGWGPEGYFKRSGAAYLDSFDGTIIGGGILPVLLHQDPRYFRLGHGSFHRRLFYTMASAFICKHDDTRKWEPNYSNIGGNIAAGAISNLYYPPQNSGWGKTISNSFAVTAEGTIGNVFQEFWPDISRKILHKDPTNGLDAQAAAADKAKKNSAQETK